MAYNTPTSKVVPAAQQVHDFWNARAGARSMMRVVIAGAGESVPSVCEWVGGRVHPHVIHPLDRMSLAALFIELLPPLILSRLNK